MSVVVVDVAAALGRLRGSGRAMCHGDAAVVEGGEMSLAAGEAWDDEPGCFSKENSAELELGASGKVWSAKSSFSTMS